jgi:ribosomal protein S18 acetylase RimI-like enzyme
MTLSIRRLDPSLLHDFLAFFDDDAFADNPEWASCYCLFFHYADNQEWEARNPAQNRETVAGLIRSGTMAGYLALEGTKVVGWCHAAPKSTLARLRVDSEVRDTPEQKVLSVVCFVIAHEHRRRGIARRLLMQVCTDAAANGYDWVEGYPRKDAKSCAQHYRGPIELYRELGFSVYRELPARWIVRKDAHA